MAPPVWVLSVDLQTKTATFVSGMGEAARSARSAFSDIRNSAREGGEGVAAAGLNVRSAIGLVDNTIRGAHAMAIADLVREFQHTAIVMAALPFAVTIAGIAAVTAVAVEVANKIREWREEQEKLGNATTKFGTDVQESFNTLDQRLLQSGIRADELRNSHLGALHKQLELIDHTSMQDLVKEFESIAKAADPVFKMLEGHWYTLGIGSAGAVHAIEQFKTKYDSLLSQGKDKEASDLLAGTRDSAQKILDAQTALKNSRQGGGLMGPSVDYVSQYKALATLKAAGVGDTEKEMRAQEVLVQALNGQITAQAKIAEIKKLDSDNAKKQTGNEASARASEAARNAAQSQLAIAQAQLAADKSFADARLVIQQASVAQRLDSDLAFSQRDMDIKLQANAAEIAALDKSGKDYTNQLKALRNQQLNIEAQHTAAVAALRARADIEQNQRDLASAQQIEREKINATDQGSAERLAAIDAAIKAAQAKNLQETDYYRQLLTQRVDTVRQKTSEEAKLKADAGREAADNALKMGELSVAAERQQMAVLDSARRMTDQQRVAESLAMAEKEFQLKQQALRSQIEALDTTGKDYQNKLQALQNKELQLIKEHENEKTAIQNQATMARNNRVLNSYRQFEQGIARSTASVLLGQQSFASVMNSIASQVAGGMIQNSLMSIMAMDMTKPHEAAAAARQMFLAGTKFPFPANLVMPPILGASAFAAVMAFNQGTDMVPGVGRGDIVPAMLTPGEGIVPGGVMDGLRNVARNGGFENGGQTVQVHVRPVYNLQALDSAGIERTLKTHTATLTKHFNQQVRRMNK
ncbi:coiled-coil domain-containing protein [Edaphobacter albus]|uniref:hypothetical protein n=1 Tax=Edaphobacter sp. 4G125 TaxID=2763071 RepID=UPI001648DE3D|nr:hypothetical protein [Edaphobacter sp. 4G125]QNI35453.1 hypothetical protein H7846_10210 [Edaphobacter sp. 4G125]